VGELLAGVEGLSVYLTAGQILGRQSVLLGETALHSLEFWNFDIAFLSAEAANADGVWNSQEAIVEMQRVAMERSKRVLLCLDETKIGTAAPQSLVGWDRVDTLLTDAKPDRLRRAGILPGFSSIIGCEAPPPLPPRLVGNASELPVHYL
jgi:DeoR/GlpR family transcriptional regulator of sugar metabolism